MMLRLQKLASAVKNKIQIYIEAINHQTGQQNQGSSELICKI